MTALEGRALKGGVRRCCKPLSDKMSIERMIRRRGVPESAG
jgi:hypothetical protein